MFVFSHRILPFCPLQVRMPISDDDRSVDSLGPSIAGEHPWHLTMEFLDWMRYPNETVYGMCLLCPSTNGVQMQCCGAPICYRCMTCWWNALRIRGAHSLLCPWCNGNTTHRWFACREGARPRNRGAISALQWRWRADLMRGHYLHRDGTLDSRAMTRFVRWMLRRQRINRRMGLCWRMERSMRRTRQIDVPVEDVSDFNSSEESIQDDPTVNDNEPDGTSNNSSEAQ